MTHVPTTLTDAEIHEPGFEDGLGDGFKGFVGFA